MHPTTRKRSPLLIALAATILSPATASAHLVSSGVGPFYDGLAHLYVSPEDLLVLVTLALFAGLAGKAAARLAVITLPAAWLFGAALGFHQLLPTSPSFLVPLCSLVTGLLVALRPKVHPTLPAVLAALLGLLHGSGNGRAMAATETPFLAAFGIAAAVSVSVLLLAALAASLKEGWQTVAARVLGSWAAAIALLALAWQFPSGSPPPLP